MKGETIILRFNNVRKSLVLVVVSIALCVGFLLFCAQPVDAATAGKKVLFYEMQAGAMSIASGYSQFYSYLQEDGYSTAFLNNQLTKETLENYDVLVLQKLASPLESSEISAIMWFLTQKSGGVFINGNEPAGVNNLAQIFGISMVADYLVDTSNPIDPNNPDKYQFVIDAPNYIEQAPRLSKIDEVGFYKGYPLSIEATTTNARAFLTASNNAFSEGGTFSVNSNPPIAATAFFGGGAVFVLSDTDMLSNTNIDQFNNSELGIAIIDWLADETTRSLSTAGSTELLSQLVTLTEENVELSSGITLLQVENAVLESRILQVESDLNQTLSGIPLTGLAGMGWLGTFLQETTPTMLGLIAGLILSAVAGFAVIITLLLVSMKRKRKEREALAETGGAELLESVVGGENAKGPTSDFLGDGDLDLDLGEEEEDAGGEGEELEEEKETVGTTPKKKSKKRRKKRK